MSPYSFDTEWDDGCPSLVEMMAREVEWKSREVSNNQVQWGVSDATGGWDISPPTSPIGGVNVGWPGALVDKHSGVWPSSSDLDQAHCDAWLGVPLDAIKIEVTVEEYSNVEDFEGEHSACRFL
jgi:hypothetical protein